MSLKGVQNILPAKGFNRALKLTVVRHPVTWVFSYYNHLLRGQFQPQYAQVFQEVRTAQSFDYFLDWLGDKPKRPISTQLIDENGEYLVDAVVRCEALMAEASVHFAPRGIEISVSKLNTGNYSTPEFSTDQKDKIFELYQDDMTAFGYGPDSALQAPVLKATPATRQVAKELGAEGLARYDCWSPF